MTSVDLMDDTFVVAEPAALAALLSEPATWRRLWPDLDAEVFGDRGDRGLRWTVTGALVGSMEIWLEPVLDGTVVHFFLRADPAGPDGRPTTLPRRALAAEHRRRRAAAKDVGTTLKRLMEGGRRPGEPPHAVAERNGSPAP